MNIKGWRSYKKRDFLLDIDNANRLMVEIFTGIKNNKYLWSIHVHVHMRPPIPTNVIFPVFFIDNGRKSFERESDLHFFYPTGQCIWTLHF